MQYRALGRTGLQVSELGYGAWGIGGRQWVGAQDEASIRSLRAAFDRGVNFFDTALAYGDGHSEELIGRAFAGNNDVIVASKIPPKNLVWPARAGTPLWVVFPQPYVLDCLDRTLKNLGRETVDLIQFHVWDDAWVREPEWQETVNLMRSSGKARFVGISINDHQPTNVLRALQTGLIDSVQVIYNIFDQSPEDHLFAFCQKNEIGVIARVPFDEGSLTGRINPDTTFAPDDFRNVYFQGERKREVWERVEKIANEAGIAIDEMPSLALRFCISHPAVTTVIPGMRSPEHVASNAAAVEAGVLEAATLEKLRKHRWVRNFYPE